MGRLYAPDRPFIHAPTASRPEATCPSYLSFLLVLLGAELGNHDLALLLGHLGVLLKLHRELALALRGRAEVRRVAEHVVERHLGHRLHEALLLLRRDDRAAALVEL